MSDEPTSHIPAVDTPGDHAQLILDTANDAFISIDETSTIVEWNQAAESILGWRREEVLGRALAETIIPERFREAHYAGIARFLETGDGPVLFETLELSALHRTGRQLPVELTIWPSRLDGRLRFNAFLRDVSERTRMQRHLELLQRVTAAANAAEDLEEAVVAALEEVATLAGWPVGHAYVRDEHDVLQPTGWWTAGSEPFRAFREATVETSFSPSIGLPGRVAEQGRPALIADIGHDENFPRLAAAKDAGLVSSFAFPVMSGTRVVAVLEFHSPEPALPDEHLLELLANIGIQLGRMFERLSWQSQLQQALEAKSQLLSLLAHEVRTPVTVVEGFADLLLEDLEDLDPEQGREYLGAIRQHAARLQRLTTNALHVSRLEAGQQAADPRPVDLDAFLAGVLANLDLARVEVTGERDVTVLVDPDHLEQILINYLTNALSYGSPPIWIEVANGASTDTDPASVVLRVCDRGEGVPASFEPELFRSFRRGTSSGGGSGLGLSIVRQLAELNGGQTWHEQLDPNGSGFALRLPRGDGEQAPDA